MGAVLNTAGAAEIAAELACCACSSVCGFICKDQATRAKLRYITILISATIMCFVMLVPGMRRTFDKVPNFCGKLVKNETCDKFFGFSAVYRIMLSMTTFYGLFAVLTMRITRADSFRAKFNNGFWIIKFIIIIGLTAGTFFVPKKSEFFRIWMYACLIGGFIFMLYQIILVVDFGHSWSVSWAEKLETNNAAVWYLAMVIATLLMFLVSIVAVVFFYLFFAGPHAFTKCKANMFYVTFIVIQCFLATVISVIPTVQQELEGAGLLQSSVVVLYTAYLTFNTLSIEPDETCNPLGKVILDYDKLSGVNGEALFGCMLTFALIIFASTMRAHTSHLGKYGMALSESEEYALSIFMKQRSKLKEMKDKEKCEIYLDDFVGYNYSLFHIIMMLASLHILMILTSWHSPDQRSNMRKLVKNWASVWVQMASSFICILIYIWFLVSPLIRKIWGPIFGIPVSEERNKRNQRGPEGDKLRNNGTADQKSNDSGRGSKMTGRESKMKGQESRMIDQRSNMRDQESKVRLADEKNLLENQNLQKTENAWEENEIKSNLKRFKSIESLKSAVSSITKRKSKKKFEKDDSSHSLILETSNEVTRDVLFEARGKETDFRDENRQQIERDKQKRGLTRFGSIESLKSGISAISIATKKVHRKLKMKLHLNKKRTRNEKKFDTDYETHDDSTVSKFEHSREDIRRPNSKLERLRNQAMSDRSRDFNEDEIRLRNRQPSPRLAQNERSQVDDDSNQKTVLGNKEIKMMTNIAHNTGQRSSETGQQAGNVVQQTDSAVQQTGNYAKQIGNTAQQTGNIVRQTGNTLQRSPIPGRLEVANECDSQTVPKQGNTQSNASGCSLSAFQQKAQDPEVAREQLRLQWKILRMQAKVVKIQEKIMRIQAEDEAAKMNAHAAVEQLEPPIEQSSTVAGSVYSKRQGFMKSKKQYG